MEDFEAFLTQKNIDPVAFKLGDAEIFSKWSKEFTQLHPESFTMHKKFFINNIRRKYQVKK